MDTEDQGWMVDDGTCDSCLFGWCGECWDPHEEFGDSELLVVCCCGEQYVLGRYDPSESAPR